MAQFAPVGVEKPISLFCTRKLKRKKYVKSSENKSEQLFYDKLWCSIIKKNLLENYINWMFTKQIQINAPTIPIHCATKNI
jgi:hypothetical protein